MERIELDEEHLRRRFITAGVLLLFGAALLAYAVMKFLTPAAGWQVIQANSTGEASCAEEITFLYEAASPAEVKAAAARYTDACQRAYRLFHCRQEFEAVVNVCTLNRRPNEVLAVYGALYEVQSMRATATCFFARMTRSLSTMTPGSVRTWPGSTRRCSPTPTTPSP